MVKLKGISCFARFFLGKFWAFSRILFNRIQICVLNAKGSAEIFRRDILINILCQVNIYLAINLYSVFIKFEDFFLPFSPIKSSNHCDQIQTSSVGDGADTRGSHMGLISKVSESHKVWHIITEMWHLNSSYNTLLGFISCNILITRINKEKSFALY